MDREIRDVAVIGLGKLGSCMAASLGARGFKVVGIDVNCDSVNKVIAGLAPVSEPGLQETITKAHGFLTATTKHDAAANTDASFFIPPTPSLPDGSFTNAFLLSAMRPVAKAVVAANNRGHIFVCCSTTTPGSMENVLIPMLEKETGWACGVDFGVCYNPEFIALGDVINGLLQPDMVLIGESDSVSGSRLAHLYDVYCTNKPHVARMSLVSAELTKISVNSFVTMKISFTNQLRMITERFGKANIHDILAAVGSDSRIGTKYLRAGVSFGGPCFPRDNRLLAYVGTTVGVEAPLANATDRVNQLIKLSLLEQTKAHLSALQQTVAVLGMAYKPSTYVVEESAGLFLAQNLQRSGYCVLVHDFVAKSSNCPDLAEFVELGDVEGLAGMPDVNVCIVCCPSVQYASLVVHPNTKLITPWSSFS